MASQPKVDAPSLLQLSGVIVDLVYRIDALPKPGSEAMVQDFTLSPGGGFNAMAAARRAGMAVVYGGKIGPGPLGAMVDKALVDEGIDVLPRAVPSADQGTSVVLIDRDGERTLIAREGGEGETNSSELNALELDCFDAVLLSGYQMSYAQSQEVYGQWIDRLNPNARLVFDPSPASILIPRPALRATLAKAWWVSLNADEAMELTGERNLQAAATQLAERRLRQDGGAVVRAGKAGCYLADQNRGVRHFPAHPVLAIDSNGAGDTHIGSFLAAFLRNGSADYAARYANVAAGISVTRRGPATAPDQAEVEAIVGRC